MKSGSSIFARNCVDLVDDLAHQVAHLVFVEALSLGPGQAPSFGIDHDNVGVVANFRYRPQAPVKFLQHRLSDAHQRHAPGKGRRPSSLPYFHACVYPSVFHIAVDIRMSRAIRSRRRFDRPSKPTRSNRGRLVTQAAGTRHHRDSVPAGRAGPVVLAPPFA